MELSVETFLESVSNPHTRKEYRYGVKAFCEWFGKSPEEILMMRQEDLTQKVGENLIEYKNRAARFEKEIERFHDYVLKQGKSINTARTATLGLRQLFRYYQMPLLMRKGTKITKTVKTTKSFPLRIEHVRAMFNVADLRERVMLSMATDLALRMSDFIRLKKADLPDLNQEPPIPFDIMTSKEDVVANAFLSAETVELLKSHNASLNQREKDRRQRAKRQGGNIHENPYLFPSNGQGSITDDTVNNMLRDLAEKVKIKVSKGQSLTFHCFRKMFLTYCIESGVGLTAGKLMCGKAVAKSDSTYIHNAKLKKLFLQLQKMIRVTDVATYTAAADRIEQLEKTIDTLKSELLTHKTAWELGVKKAASLEKQIQELKEEVKDLSLQYVVESAYQNEDMIRSQVYEVVKNALPDADVSEVFYDILVGVKNVVVDITGFLDKEGKFKEFKGHILLPKPSIP